MKSLQIKADFWKKPLTIYLVIENWNAKKTSKKMSKAERLGSGAKDCNWWGEVKKLETFLRQWRLSCSANAVSDFGLLNGKRTDRKQLEQQKAALLTSKHFWFFNNDLKIYFFISILLMFGNIRIYDLLRIFCCK